MIVDTTYVHTLPNVEGVIYKLPISMTARDKIGKEMVANVVALVLQELPVSSPRKL
ncbi:hypothetical protein [Desulfoscipio gibsoniae]|uniref:hypothetical protein n=1 Tax=Desulfoscipio gibsoniae TaxID=102134 RepID=UPI000232BC8F|nr:hypothetical protein [Desulfoscipio gibsoniae]